MRAGRPRSQQITSLGQLHLAPLLLFLTHHSLLITHHSSLITHHFLLPHTFRPGHTPRPAVPPGDRLLNPFPQAARPRLFASGSRDCRLPEPAPASLECKPAFPPTPAQTNPVPG